MAYQNETWTQLLSAMQQNTKRKRNRDLKGFNFGSREMHPREEIRLFNIGVISSTES